MVDKGQRRLCYPLLPNNKGVPMRCYRILSSLFLMFSFTGQAHASITQSTCIKSEKICEKIRCKKRKSVKVCVALTKACKRSDLRSEASCRKWRMFQTDRLCIKARQSKKCLRKRKLAGKVHCFRKKKPKCSRFRRRPSAPEAVCLDWGRRLGCMPSKAKDMKCKRWAQKSYCVEWRPACKKVAYKCKVRRIRTCKRMRGRKCVKWGKPKFIRY